MMRILLFYFCVVRNKHKYPCAISNFRDCRDYIQISNFDIIEEI